VVAVSLKNPCEDSNLGSGIRKTRNLIPAIRCPAWILRFHGHFYLADCFYLSDQNRPLFTLAW
jgi:hypothetical protein